MSRSTEGTATSSSCELNYFGAAEIARRIADGVTTSVNVVESHIARIEALQPRFNMMSQNRFEAARQEAARADELRETDDALPLLHGVPVTVKECFHVAGMPTNLGLTGQTESPQTHDANLVRKLKEAGAIVVAKSNIPQLMLYCESDNPRYGRTQTRTPGRSARSFDNRRY